MEGVHTINGTKLYWYIYIVNAAQPGFRDILLCKVYTQQKKLQW